MQKRGFHPTFLPFEPVSLRKNCLLGAKFYLVLT